MTLTKAETRIYAAGLALQATLPPRTGITLRQLSETTGYSIQTAHKAAKKLAIKRMAGWPMKEKNRRKGALRFWQVKS
jgi:hypothetical protein